jgi:guanylate kinase
MSKRIILVGSTCSGKNFIREQFVKRGYTADVSYTSRVPRENEITGVDYHFISKESFEDRIFAGLFYEWVNYGDKYYGTGKYEWDNADIFIMETDGIKEIHKEDRKNCLVIFINTPLDTRIKRMKERGWDENKIAERIKIDTEKFTNFTDFDIQIISQENEEKTTL